ncbi:hypothetical protein GJ633_05210 [Halorubrum sp. CBA1125]|nr:hypothetical protein [Halorubrum sp. CBA1125]MUW14123.1 hypothetical protein [Halorubrum sp. CBA1125]
MPIPATCPECGDADISVVTVPPSEHAYDGWQTAIECDTCDERVFAAELE